MDKILSDRECEVAEHLVFFGTKKEAAPVLGITDRTMETHSKNIYRKLGITKLNELILIYCSKTFNIGDQILAKKEELSKKKKEIASGAIASILFVSFIFDTHVLVRYRRYQRRPDIEYITTAPIPTGA